MRLILNRGHQKKENIWSSTLQSEWLGKIEDTRMSKPKCLIRQKSCTLNKTNKKNSELQLEFGGLPSDVMVASCLLGFYIPAIKRTTFILTPTFYQLEIDQKIEWFCHWPLGLISGIRKLFPGGLREEEDQSPTDHHQGAEACDGDGPVVHSQHAERRWQQARDPKAQGAQANRCLPEIRIAFNYKVFNMI